MKRIIIPIIIAGLLSACASVDRVDTSALYEDYIRDNKLESLTRITAFNYRGWRSLDNRHLIINTSPNKPYLITLAANCHDLRFSHGIAINSRGTSSLYARSDSISTSDYPQKKCFIKTIHALTKEQADEVSGLRKKAKEQLKRTS